MGRDASFVLMIKNQVVVTKAIVSRTNVNPLKHGNENKLEPGKKMYQADDPWRKFKPSLYQNPTTRPEESQHRRSDGSS